MAYKLKISVVLFTVIIAHSFAQKKIKTIELLDANLSHFEKWNGVPHSTVKDLPEGTYQSKNVIDGTPLGLNNDIKNVFSVIIEDGEPVLKITGEIYGGLTTKETYSNYYFSAKFKWGDKKWEPRLDAKRDTGILYHCYGAHGRFWKTWKTSLEYQVQETDIGDFISLSGNTETPKLPGPLVQIRGNAEKLKFDPASENYFEGKGYIHASLEPDAPHGEWNHLEIYVVGNNAVHVVNGEIVMVVEDARTPDGKPLTEGQIQIQSEAAECYYKQVNIKFIKKFPKKIRKQVRFKS